MSAASPLPMAMELHLSRAAAFFSDPKEMSADVPNWQWIWCFVHLSCNLQETELGYCKSVSGVMLWIWIFVRAHRTCWKIHHYQKGGYRLYGFLWKPPTGDKGKKKKIRLRILILEQKIRWICTDELKSWKPFLMNWSDHLNRESYLI